MMKSKPCDISLICLLRCCLVAGLIVLGQQVWGQNPFESTPTGEPADAAADDEEQEEMSEFEKQAAAETDPVVRMILDAKPTTPDQWIHDVRTLLNLKRPVFAKEYLKQFLNVLPSEEELVQIQSRYGSAFFLRLTNRAELQPEGAAVADAVMKAASARMADTARINALVDRLSDPDAAARRAALVELVKAGPAAVTPLISVLADDSRQAEHAAVRAAIVALGDVAVEPLIATLHSPHQPLRLQAIELLGKLKAMQAVPAVLSHALAPENDGEREASNKMLRQVLGDVPSKAEATGFLSRRMENYLAGSVPGAVDEADQVRVWIWDATQQIPRQESYSADDASFLAATLAAEQLHRIAPNNADFERMYLATGLEVAKRTNGYDRPLTEETGTVYQDASSAGNDVLQEVLRLALNKQMEGAAVAVIDLLGQSKSAELLQSDDGQPTLLATALVSPLPRVKFAAAQAVMNIDPAQSYPGSSYLVDVLGFLSAGVGERRVLIGHPRVAQAQVIAGHLNVLGFTVDTTQTGRETALRAFSSPDYTFVLVHDAIDHPAYRELIQTLRHDQRTAKLPVGLITRDINKQQGEWFAKTDPLTLDLAPAPTLEDVASDTRRLLTLAGRSQILPDERIRQAQFALDALAQLASDPEKYDFYDLLPLDERIEGILSTPILAARAAKVLGQLATPRAQLALVRFASTQTHPLADRQAAATAFRAAVTLRGLLLTRPQLLRQYDIYNASEILDPETQQVLASILDAIEAPSQAAKAARDGDQP